MRFTKMHGLGNDYVYVCTFDQPAPSDPAGLAISVSDRHFGIGSDGLILIMPSERADARMRMFNADGSEGEMCGNGVRCVAKYVFDHGLVDRRQVTVETGRGVLTLDLEVLPQSGSIRSGSTWGRRHVPVGPSRSRPSSREIRRSKFPSRRGRSFAVTAVSTWGTRTRSSSSTTWPVFPLRGRSDRCWSGHPSFPRRVNVHFVEVRSATEVTMRTWERGSGITLACGTGACAVCVAGVLTGRTGSKFLAHVPGGDLQLVWEGDGQPVDMTGPATEVFEGEWPVTR